MKIPELRELLDRTSPDELKRMVIELYKAIPKKVRDERGIDEFLSNPAVSEKADRKKTGKESIGLDALRAELDEFLINAYAYHYIAPNRFVSKAERPKWRFKVKRFHKELLAAATDHERAAQAGELLAQLYLMLCRACAYVMFTAYDVFESVGIQQTDFLDNVLGLKAQYLDSAGFIDSALRLMFDSELNRYTLGANLAQVVLNRLQIPESIELAIERAAELHQNPPLSKDKEASEYCIEEKCNWLVVFGFLAYMKLEEPEKALAFFKARYIESTPEIFLFIVLRWLARFGLKDLWLREYEQAVRDGIQPREALRRAYAHLKEKGELPSSY